MIKQSKKAIKAVKSPNNKESSPTQIVKVVFNIGQKANAMYGIIITKDNNGITIINRVKDEDRQYYIPFNSISYFQTIGDKGRERKP
jgi:hypothetical protein